MSYQLTAQFEAIRRTSTPLVALTTADAPATAQAVTAALVAMSNNETPVLQWDVVRGLVPLTPAGQAAVAALSGKAQQLTNPVELLRSVPQLAPDTVLLAHNLHLFLAQPGVVQALANLRESCKAQGQTLVILCPALTLPPELRQDVLVLDEPLPDQASLERIVTQEYRNYQQATAAPLPDLNGALPHATDALRGLSGFAAEQEVAMALSDTGLDVARLWHRKRQLIAQTQGLAWYTPTARETVLGGYRVLRKFLTRLVTGRKQCRLVVYIDEIDTHLAGAQGDNTGVSQYMHGALLTYMQDRHVTGALLLGPPGTGKTTIAKTIGTEAAVPTCTLDLGATKSKGVGDSEANLRAVFRTLDALADGNMLLIGSCNSIDALSPQMRRRFQGGGTWLVDLPDDDERLDIWQLHLARYPELQSQKVPVDREWTGADIAQCVDLAYALETTLLDAARYIVPVAVAAVEQVARLRREAAGRYLSASYEGVYRLQDEQQKRRQYARS